MFYNENFIIILLLICSTFKSLASTKQNIIQNLKDTQTYHSILNKT